MKFFFSGVLVIALCFGGYILIQILRSNTGGSAESVDSGDNVRMEDGKQIIELTAKGGYTPRVSRARAGVPTILRFDTKGTFDCSSQVRIPSKQITRTLPQSGTTDIDLGTLETGTLQGSCGMGMYPFEIEATE